jgi:hypothetical protein
VAIGEKEKGFGLGDHHTDNIARSGLLTPVGNGEVD